MKRTALTRKTPLRRTAKPRKPKVLTEADRKYDEFMKQFRGLPDIKTGRTWFLRDDKGNPILTAGHHLLPRSTYPEYRMTKENIVPLDLETHGWAEDHPDEFTRWLAEHRPEVLAWRDANSHHRKEG